MKFTILTIFPVCSSVAVCPKQDLKQQLKSMNKKKNKVLFSENPTKLSSIYEALRRWHLVVDLNV